VFVCRNCAEHSYTKCLVGHDITPKNIISLTSLQIIKARRITSKKTNRPTSFIRVITTEKETVDALFIYGIQLFGRESSHPPTSTPVQCAKCFQFSHGQVDCLKKQICPKCANSHPQTNVQQKTPPGMGEWLLGNVHLNDNVLQPNRRDPNYEKLYKIRPYLAKLSATFSTFYVPSKAISIDEYPLQRAILFASIYAKQTHKKWI
jgi:hypothetical protein